MTKKDIPRRFSRDPKPKHQSPIMRILSSPKTTLVLGLFAFASIFFYKRFILSKDIPPPEKTVEDIAKEKPLFASKDALGRAREGGILLTKSFFDSGDLILRQNRDRLEIAVIARRAGQPFVMRPRAQGIHVMTWLRETDGRFALFRLPPTPRPTLLRALARLQSPTPPASAPTTAPQIPPHAQDDLALFTIYRDLKIKLPTYPKEHSQAALQAALQIILQKAHYNDLAP
jgi:hypothetical protein